MRASLAGTDDRHLKPKGNLTMSSEQKRIYSTLKYTRFADQLDAIANRRVTAPGHVRIKPYNHCNHNCWYCAYRVDNLQLGENIDLTDQIPYDKMMEITEDIIDMGVKAVTFSGGGEPLIYKPLIEVIDRLAEGRVRIAALSNGSNLKGKMAEAFAAHATWIRISVDGWDDASYAAAREIKEGAFTQLLENMRAFSDLKSPCVLGISLIVDNKNCRHIFEAAKKFKAAGANHVKVSGVVVSNDGKENNAYHANITDIVTDQLTQAAALNSEDFRIINHYHELPERFDKQYDYCPYLQFQTIIGADCKVYACHDKAYTDGGLLGDIANRSFKDFWFSEENHQRLFGINPSIQCRHHCMANHTNLSILDYLSIDSEHGRFV